MKLFAMRRIIFLVLLFTFEFATAQNVGIGTNTPATSAKLDVTSTNSGLLPPRMTYAQRNAIVNPVAGLIIYCTDCANGEMQYYNGTTWMQMTVALGSVPFVVPTVTTIPISSITTSIAISGGNITSDGGAFVTARGVVWDTLPLPTITLSTKTTDGTDIGNYTSNIRGLLQGKSYHVRAYATNSIGTSYGGDLTFTTPQTYSYVAGPSVTDANGNTYNSIITSCGQTWTTKNLNVSRYRNGDIIPQVTNATQWSNLTSGAWCWYNNDSATYAATYGKLYNWFAVTDPRGLAPTGWHVPSDSEWNVLVKCIDSTADTTYSNIGVQSTIAGGALKEIGTTHWLYPNTGASNISGFSCIPGGGRDNNGISYAIFSSGKFWTTTESSATNAWHRGLIYNTSDINRNTIATKLHGFSVRLLRDY
jgi:uncharacterized protein (TIGR02145 family)